MNNLNKSKSLPKLNKQQPSEKSEHNKRFFDKKLRASKSASSGSFRIEKKSSPKNNNNNTNDDIFVKNTKLEEVSINHEIIHPRITAFWNDLLDDDPEDAEAPEDLKSPQDHTNIGEEDNSVPKKPFNCNKRIHAINKIA